ncbi:CesT family type III secretion system chaperone [Paracidovorax oryzae]|uniref:CesT family type III secretion system chaperone n=1 Tax=Paracidovorax oryzae TaxID=862720 RepID=UPI00047E2793|nr:CesT family type III secretion system chaperone [Paracidovorax oryzae]
MTTKTTESAQAHVPPRIPLSPARRACLAAALQHMGADDGSVRAFAEQGMVMVNDVLLAIASLQERDDGRWLASALLPRPEGVSEARWSEALLVANGQAILLAPWAFSLDDSGAAVLLMPLEPGMADARMLAAHFDGMLSLCEAVSTGARALAQAAQTGKEAA